MEEKKERTRMGHRWEVDIPLDYTPLNSNWVWEAKILDLSLRGIRMSSLSVPMTGEEVKLTINMPGELGEIDALGKVTWARRTEAIPYCGIVFTKIKDMDRARIISYIDKNFGDELRKKVWWQDG